MAIDDELDAMKPAGMPTEMERWNVEDLQDYIDRMRAEIARVEAIIAGKDTVTAAATALFGDPS